MTVMRDGQIITFYSFKGGTGRTMALANVAWILAAAGKKVLAVDWDLESPGLSRYYNPFLPAAAVRDTPGVIDLIREFDTEAIRRERRQEDFEDVAAYARTSQYVLPLNWSFPNEGRLDYMSYGRQNMDYASTIGNLSWDNFYDKLHGGKLFTALREDMKRNYDYTFIDSRTGYSDIAGICTFHLPDTLVDCFTLNTQGIEGAVRVANDVARYRPSRVGQQIRVLPVPMRVENTEKAKADAGYSLARRRFEGFPADLDEEQRDRYWSNVVIPYQAYYSYEEILATFGDANSGPTTLLGAYERLAGYVTRNDVTVMPPMEPGSREHWLKRFERTSPSDIRLVLLDYEPEDEAWAEWVERVLSEVKVRVGSARGAARPRPENNHASITLTIVSRAFMENSGNAASAGAPGDAYPTVHRALYISDVHPLDQLQVDGSERVDGQTAVEAITRLVQLVGCEAVPQDAVRRLTVHYPSNEPVINNVPARNARFTGRSSQLRQLRKLLREQRVATIIPLNLPGGVGKTQLALEYVYRFKSEYDVVWWVRSGQTQFVDTELVDLGAALARQFGVQISAGPGTNAEDDALAVIKLLGQGGPAGRWLLVFDDADDPAFVRRFFPSGNGHILVTSRDRTWDQYTATLDIGVFDHDESIAHLCGRAPLITPEEAGELAHALGDLPFAVSLTGAWLNETGTRVSEHLRRLELQGPKALGGGSPMADYPTTLLSVLESSLEEVQTRSAAAYRLLQLCSCLSGGSIALGLIYSQAMVAMLEKYDGTLTEPNDIARHVQLLNRLALIKLDNHAREFQVHNLLQAHLRQQMLRTELDAVKHEVHTLLASNRPRRDADDPDTWPRYRMLWPHLDPSDAVNCHTEPVRSLMIDRLRYMWTRGPLQAAEQTGRSIQQLWQARLNESEPGEDATTLRKQLLHLSFNLANVLRDLARYEEAWQLDTELIEEQQELLGPEHRHSLMTSSGLCADLRALGRYTEAVELAETTFHSWSRVFGDDFPRTLDAANNLAITYRLAGRYAEARVLDEATYEGRRTTLGERHPRVFHSGSAIGRNMREAGQYARSVEWLTGQLQAIEALPEPSPRTVSEIRINLAVSLRATGRFASAVPYVDEAFEAIKSLVHFDHPDALMCRLCRSSNLLAMHDYDEAEQVLRGVMSAYSDLVGADHPLTLACASNYSALLRALGSLDEAESTARDTSERLQSVLSADHPYTIAAEMNLAVCLADKGQLDESRALDEHAVERLTRTLGPSHPDALRAIANLALTRRAQGDRSATSGLNRITDQLGALIGHGHPSVVALQNGIRNHRVLDPPQPF
jgi:tetratricopeptide (TPR) repeat protein